MSTMPKIPDSIPAIIPQDRHESLPIGFRRLAANVILQALSEATAPRSDPEVPEAEREDARTFLKDGRAEMWASACGKNADCIRQWIARPDHRFPRTLSVLRAARIFGVSSVELRKAVAAAVKAGQIKTAEIWHKNRVYTLDMIEIAHTLQRIEQKRLLSPSSAFIP